jgi:hypothetical protein
VHWGFASLPTRLLAKAESAGARKPFAVVYLTGLNPVTMLLDAFSSCFPKLILPIVEMLLKECYSHRINS